MEPDIQNMNRIAKMIYLILQIGFTVLVTIFMCIGLGYLCEKVFHARLMVWFVVLGVLAGFKAAVILIKKFVSFENPDDEYIRMISRNRDDEEDDGEDDMRP